ncbi:coiled-coil domain-containing protein 74A-like [Lingula anatina]|uniref:Coiled-coil domain-containing protein 74A n=1 Tax=Lingula anatina TaxID=7574 RepID=A0A1S3JNW4_LINAN|nr:coiled-coil domain-containing protein 74A [Lingula anatina]XP_023930748.1 coiled-coil domain-containing protein 74A-like [Lingula anatina]|eukprot:XP_013412048.1 coiled-coil domain-containing protein 74A [Lingula anatina]
MSAQTQLPPLNNLPQWSRVHTLDKARYPKPFVKDRLNPMPMADLGASNPPGSSESDRDLDFTSMDPVTRIQYLEKSIGFLKHQHKEVLSSLHEEIEALKKENKDLQFELIMIQKNQQLNSSSANNATSQKLEVPDRPTDKEQSSISLRSRTAEGDSVTDQSQEPELKHIFLEEEIKDLKETLREARNHNTYLKQLLEQEQSKSKELQQQVSSQSHESPAAYGQPQNTPIDMSSITASLNPLQIHPANQPPRQPTLQECEMIIRHMQHVNEKQSHELNRLKSDLRDVLYSHKWTPDAYLLAKAYVAEEEKGEVVALDPQARLPKIHKHPGRKLPEVAYIASSEKVSLPALTQTVGNKAVERRKRTQILQKARLRKEVL